MWNAHLISVIIQYAALENKNKNGQEYSAGKGNFYITGNVNLIPRAHIKMESSDLFEDTMTYMTKTTYCVHIHIRNKNN